MKHLVELNSFCLGCWQLPRARTYSFFQEEATCIGVKKGQTSEISKVPNGAIFAWRRRALILVAPSSFTE